MDKKNIVMVVVEKTYYFNTGVDMEKEKYECKYNNGRLQIYHNTFGDVSVSPYHISEEIPSEIEFMNETDGGYIKPK